MCKKRPLSTSNFEILHWSGIIKLATCRDRFIAVSFHPVNFKSNQAQSANIKRSSWCNSLVLPSKFSLEDIVCIAKGRNLNRSTRQPSKHQQSEGDELFTQLNLNVEKYKDRIEGLLSNYKLRLFFWPRQLPCTPAQLHCDDFNKESFDALHCGKFS